jgi:hypothetical protein
VTGEVAGTCIDSKDHLVTVNRGNLVSPETLVATAAPPVIEFDTHGNVVTAWGDRDELPNGIHGCFVDYQDNVWIAGNGDGIVQKYSHDGTLLMQIGTRDFCDSPTGTCGSPGLNSSTTLLDQPADMAVDPSNGDIYIADGYGNHRVVVFDQGGGYLRQWGNAGIGPGQFALADGGHPHCIVLGKDGHVYACDRGKIGSRSLKEPTNCTGLFPTVLACGSFPVVPYCTGPPSVRVRVAGDRRSAWDVDFSATSSRGTCTIRTAETRWSGSSIVRPPLRAYGRLDSGGFGCPATGRASSRSCTPSPSTPGQHLHRETINGRRIQRFKPDGRHSSPEQDGPRSPIRPVPRR